MCVCFFIKIDLERDTYAANLYEMKEKSKVTARISVYLVERYERSFQCVTKENSH